MSSLSAENDRYCSFIITSKCLSGNSFATALDVDAISVLEMSADQPGNFSGNPTIAHAGCCIARQQRVTASGRCAEISIRQHDSPTRVKIKTEHENIYVCDNVQVHTSGSRCYTNPTNLTLFFLGFLLDASQCCVVNSPQVICAVVV